jgi:hypothetical protein
LIVELLNTYSLLKNAKVDMITELSAEGELFKIETITCAIDKGHFENRDVKLICGDGTLRLVFEQGSSDNVRVSINDLMGKQVAVNISQTGNETIIDTKKLNIELLFVNANSI